MTAELDIIIPVYNEGAGILMVLEALQKNVRTSFRGLLCYDRDDDNTLSAVRGASALAFEVQFVKNRRRGAHGAVVTGFEESTAPAVIVFPGDDDYNAGRIDLMMDQFREGCDIVAASRFMRGGCMIGCPWLKAALIRSSAFLLFHVARVPTHASSTCQTLPQGSRA